MILVCKVLWEAYLMTMVLAPGANIARAMRDFDSTAEELLAEVVELYVARQAALAQTPPNEVLAAELQAQIGELLARAAELEGVLAAGDTDDDVDA